jgi:hypothetical protein
LRTAHRNRYVFALPFFQDAAFADAFLDAEKDHLEREASFDEIRATSGAAVDVLARLPSLASQRLPDGDDADHVCSAARRILLDLRAVCNISLRAR